jgi:hypothetical protein
VELMRALWQDTEAEFRVTTRTSPQLGMAEAGPAAVGPGAPRLPADTARLCRDRRLGGRLDQVVLDLQAVEGDILAVLDRYAAVLTAI